MMVSAGLPSCQVLEVQAVGSFHMVFDGGMQCWGWQLVQALPVPVLELGTALSL